MPRLAVNFRKARAHKPRGRADDKSNLQSQVHAAPGIEVGEDEARHADDFQDAIEINGLRQLLQNAWLYAKSTHDDSLSGRCISKMMCGSSSPATGARLP